MTPCEDKSCPVCYPNRLDDAAAARKKRDDDRHECVEMWRFYQKKAEAIVAVADPIARNRRINAEYAKLWLGDRRFQWAGLAAFASKQVGCGLLNARALFEKSNQQRDDYQKWRGSSSLLEQMSPVHSPRVRMPDQGEGAGAATVYEMLAKGNMALFLDVWPLHMFYKEYGLRRFKQCLRERMQLRGRVRWELNDDVPFGEPWAEITDGFSAIENGNIALGVDYLARHEQVNILRPAIYEDWMFASLMRANQFLWVTSFPTGSAKEIQLTLAVECELPNTDTKVVRFSDKPFADLSNVGQRLEFTLRLAAQFDALLKDPKQKVLIENSLYLIAHAR
ncbi:DUF2515 family protein [Pandoraea norimbergensis]|uniref:Uncharacterized protein n=1 Tax=Pandoraea norimbergensis TaxID=93219 RepID=A0ABN4JIC8_9BURK|nr:hypothetical protein [Pandoraea norimbergensis]ALS60738.1 hypothetical protein AT302_14090 [Pandoraea norimbergensis]